MKDVFEYLKKRGIAYTGHSHPPVYTVEQARKYRNGIEGVHCKNLFLEDSRRGQFYLLTVPADKSIHLNSIRKQIRAKKLSFAREESLEHVLGLEAGSVSPLGLINDDKNETIFIVDQSLWNAERLTFHPNVNTMTLEITGIDFQRLVRSFGNEFLILPIAARE